MTGLTLKNASLATFPINLLSALNSMMEGGCSNLTIINLAAVLVNQGLYVPSTLPISSLSNNIPLESPSTTLDPTRTLSRMPTAVGPTDTPLGMPTAVPIVNPTHTPSGMPTAVPPRVPSYTWIDLLRTLIPSPASSPIFILPEGIVLEPAPLSSTHSLIAMRTDSLTPESLRRRVVSEVPLYCFTSFPGRNILLFLSSTLRRYLPHSLVFSYLESSSSQTQSDSLSNDHHNVINSMAPYSHTSSTVKQTVDLMENVSLMDSGRLGRQLTLSANLTPMLNNSEEGTTHRMFVAISNTTAPTVDPTRTPSGKYTAVLTSVDMTTELLTIDMVVNVAMTNVSDLIIPKHIFAICQSMRDFGYQGFTVTAISATALPTTFLSKQELSDHKIQPASQLSLPYFPTVSYVEVIEISRSSVTVNVTLIKPNLMTGDLTRGIVFCIGVHNGSLPTSIGGIKSAATDGSLSVGASVDIPATREIPTAVPTVDPTHTPSGMPIAVPTVDPTRTPSGMSTSIIIPSSSSITLSVKFTGLKSLHYYAIFCYADTSLGTGTSLDRVLQVSSAATTTCCKVLDFSNTPVSVYGELSKYTGLSASLHVFKYDLSAAPSRSVMVMPLLYLDGVPSTAVKVSPSFSTFLSSSPLTGQFILSAGPLISGVYTIGFTFNGLSKSQYSNRNMTVQILSSLSQLPAPMMISSQFSDSGQLVVITFDSPTDSASIASATWPCSALFAFTGAPLATCTWSTSSTVNVIIRAVKDIAVSDSSINIGSSVTLLGGHLRSYCVGGGSSCTSNPTASNITVLTLKAWKPSAPTVIISSPANLGPCDDLILDTTESYGNGGRLYTSVIWTVSAITYGDTDLIVNTSAIQAYVNDFSSKYQMHRPITIPGSMLVAASYTITARLTNFLGVSSSNTIIVSKGSDPKIPNLTIIGPSYRLIVASSPLTILSVVEQSSCISETTDVTYSWTVQKGYPLKPAGLSSVSRDPSRFSLPAYNLTVDATYIVTITASVGKASTSVSVTVYVAHGVVTAAVMGGYTRSIPADQDILLDASISTDDDAAPFAISTLAYEVRSPHIITLSFCAFSMSIITLKFWK